jgi:tetratricopeptide (TPR) repeat protein
VASGKPAEAEVERRQAMALYQKLADDEPAVYGSQVWFRNIDLIIERAERSSREGKLAEAEAAYRDALSSCQKLADAHPGVTEIRVRLALSHFQFGVQLSWWGKLTEAEAEYREMLSLFQRLVDRHPGHHQRQQLAFRRNSRVLCRQEAAKQRDRVSPGAEISGLIDEHGEVFST